MKTRRWTRLLAGILFASAALLFSSGWAAALNVGDKAPSFALPATTGAEVKWADFAGKQPVVLFFYIGAFTNT